MRDKPEIPDGEPWSLADFLPGLSRPPVRASGERAGSFLVTFAEGEPFPNGQSVFSVQLHHRVGLPVSRAELAEMLTSLADEIRKATS